MSSNENEMPAAVAQAKHERLRFSEFTFERTADGRCNAVVELEWWDGLKVRGTASGQSSSTVDLRVAADAALRALELFSDNVLSFELAGIKAIRAFDATVIIVSITNRRADGPRRLLGSALVETDPVRGAVIAALCAANRMLGNFVALR